MWHQFFILFVQITSWELQIILLPASIQPCGSDCLCNIQYPFQPIWTQCICVRNWILGINKVKLQTKQRTQNARPFYAIWPVSAIKQKHHISNVNILRGLLDNGDIGYFIFSKIKKYSHAANTHVQELERK